VEALAIDAEATLKMLVAFLREGFQTAGFKKGVVGLSGGVDSALAATLAAEALGPDNVQALFMPYKTSDPLSREHARLAAEKLGTAFREIDISPQVDVYFTDHTEADQVRRGNKMARERMSILYDQSAAWKGLVVGTSNRTEILLGYGTLFGDTACSINPLAGLLKTQVFQLARFAGVPEEIINKPPTADLWQGQTDESELGLSYADVDRLIVLMIDRKLPDENLRSEGFEQDFIDRVRGMIACFAFKSRPPMTAGPPAPA